MCCEQLFFRRLRESGLRLTPQREMVLSAMHEIAGHTTVEGVYERVHARSSSVDISTVYRTLELLHEFNLVASVDLDDGQLRYELLGVRGQHHHLRCRSCGRLTTVGNEDVQYLSDHLLEAHGFEAELGHVIISGLCRQCRVARDETLGAKPPSGASNHPER